MSCFGGGEVDDDYDMESNGTCPDCGCETFDGVSVYPACVYSPVICKTCGGQVNMIFTNTMQRKYKNASMMKQ